jgi:superfamily I DNA and/or RNA helicase
MDEVTTVNHLIRDYYSREEVCIITPYDMQRQAISDDLQVSRLLAWEHVYNVDSFQGQYTFFVGSHGTLKLTRHYR